MDPTRAWAGALRAMSAGDWRAAGELLTGLIGWMDRGGFCPGPLFTACGQDRMTARVLCVVLRGAFLANAREGEAAEMARAAVSRFDAQQARIKGDGGPDFDPQTGVIYGDMI